MPNSDRLSATTNPQSRRSRNRLLRGRWILTGSGLLLLLFALQGQVWLAAFAHWRGQAALEVRQLNAAYAWFDRADRFNSGYGTHKFAMARVERLRGRSDRMQAHLDNAIRDGFARDRAQREQILAQAQSGHIQQVERALSQMLMSPGDDGPAICEAMASGYLAVFRLSEAMAILEGWSRDYPSDPQPLVVRGMYFSQRQAWAQAAAEFEKALGLAPRRDDVRVHWAEALRNLHRLDQAREQFERASRTITDSPAVWVGLGRCLMESGRMTEARQAFEEALRISPKSWEAQFWTGKLLANEGDHARAVPILETAYRERPFEPDVRYSLALALQAAGRTDEARKHFDYIAAQQKAQSELRNKLEDLERTPSRIDLRYEVGMILVEYGNPQEGLSWLKSVLDLDPTHPGALAAVKQYSGQTPSVSPE